MLTKKQILWFVNNLNSKLKFVWLCSIGIIPPFLRNINNKDTKGQTNWIMTKD